MTTKAQQGLDPLAVVVGAVRAVVDGSDVALTPYTGAELGAIATTARRHLVLPLVHRVIGAREDVDAPAWRDAAAMRDTAMLAHLTTIADLHKLQKVLAPLGHRWLVLKGPVLSEHYYPDPSTRRYLDLDVLVSPDAFGDALDLLEASGATLVDVNWSLIRSSRRGELSLRLWNGTALDLHWSVIAEAKVRRSLAVPTRPLIADQRMLDIGGLSVPTLSVADTTPYLALHAMLNGGARLGWLCDVALALNQDRWGTDVQWRRAAAHGIALPAHVAIERVQKLFGPIGLTDAYATLSTERPWRLLVGGAAKLRDPLATVDKHLSLRLIDRSTRSTTMGSVRALAGSLWREGIVPLVADRRHPWRSHGVDAEGASSPLWEASGSPAERRDFLAGLARMP